MERVKSKLNPQDTLMWRLRVSKRDPGQWVYFRIEMDVGHFASDRSQAAWLGRRTNAYQCRTAFNCGDPVTGAEGEAI